MNVYSFRIIGAYNFNVVKLIGVAKKLNLSLGNVVEYPPDNFDVLFIIAGRNLAPILFTFLPNKGHHTKRSFFERVEHINLKENCDYLQIWKKIGSDLFLGTVFILPYSSK